jgi:thioredoxin reductase
LTAEPEGVVIEALSLDFPVSGEADRRGAFPELTGDQIDLLRTRGTERRIDRGDILFREGDSSYPFIAIFVFIGAEPHILTGEAAGRTHELETSSDGVFAVGDVRSGSVKRVAAAVGEGATAIRLVHERLGAAT